MKILATDIPEIFVISRIFRKVSEDPFKNSVRKNYGKNQYHWCQYLSDYCLHSLKLWEHSGASNPTSKRTLEKYEAVSTAYLPFSSPRPVIFRLYPYHDNIKLRGLVGVWGGSMQSNPKFHLSCSECLDFQRGHNGF